MIKEILSIKEHKEFSYLYEIKIYKGLVSDNLIDMDCLNYDFIKINPFIINEDNIRIKSILSLGRMINSTNDILLINLIDSDIGDEPVKMYSTLEGIFIPSRYIDIKDLILDELLSKIMDNIKLVKYE